MGNYLPVGSASDPASEQDRKHLGYPAALTIGAEKADSAQWKEVAQPITPFTKTLAIRRGVEGSLGRANKVNDGIV